jgi:hypothetical protein
VLLIGNRPPMPQDDLGPPQGIDRAAIMAPVTRSSRALREVLPADAVTGDGAFGINAVEIDAAGMARPFGLHAECVTDRQALTAWDEAEQERRR